MRLTDILQNHLAKKHDAQTYVTNLLNKFEVPFESPIKPEFGPLFPRNTWKEKFLSNIERMYLLYYGASNTGKSVAVAAALAGFKGVVYFRVQQQGDIWQGFASAISFLDKKLQTIGEKILLKLRNCLRG